MGSGMKCMAVLYNDKRKDDFDDIWEWIERSFVEDEVD